MQYKVEIVFDEENADTPEEAADIVLRYIKETWPEEAVKCTVTETEWVFNTVDVMADGQTVPSGPF